MLAGSAVLAGGWTLARQHGIGSASVPATGSGLGGYEDSLVYSYTQGNRHPYFEIAGGESGAFSGEFEGELVLVENLTTGNVVAHGQGEFSGTIRGCGSVEESFQISGEEEVTPVSRNVGTIHASNPILFEQSLSFGSGSDFSYQAAWVACTSKA